MRKFLPFFKYKNKIFFLIISCIKERYREISEKTKKKIFRRENCFLMKIINVYWEVNKK